MKKVLYIVEDTRPAQFRYRVENVIEALKSSSNWRAEWMLTSKFQEKNLDEVDLIVVLRQSDKDGKILKIIKKAKAKGIKVLFDLDDLIFDFRDLLVLMRGTNSKNVVYWAGYVWGIRRIAKKVDGFITTNDFLAGKLKRSFDKNTKVIPNSLNSEQVRIADECLKNKKHDGFLIGYFSGSPTHNKDLRMVEPEILKFLDAHEDAKFMVVGYMELSSEMQKMVKKKKVEIVKLVDYKKLIELMSRVDVNIAPLLINDFTNSKSELKFFEAAAVETTTIASPAFTFSRAITDSQNGFLAKPGEWHDKLEYLYKNLAENIKIAKKARKYALENYYGEKFLEKIENTYDAF